MLETKSLQQLALDFVNTREERSFSILYNRLKPGLRKFVQKFHQDPEVVDEILAITLSKAFVYADTYDPQWAFSTWIYRICRNECLMEIRRKSSMSSLDSLFESKAPIRALNSEDWKIETEYEFFEDEESVQPDYLYSEVLEEIKNLPDHYREIIQDRIVEKLKYKDIAEKRNLKINTVRSRIHSAKKVIKNMWIERKKKNGGSKTINILGVTILNLLDEKEKPSRKSETSKGHFSKVTIIEAKYGSDFGWVDVTEKVSKTLEERGEVKANNRIGGDPCYGKAKMLSIKFLRDGVELTEEVKEGKIFRVS